jgi:hypothetical protein
MPGRVDQVELVGLAIGRGVLEGDRIALDRDAPLTLEIHAVEDLVTKLSIIDRPAGLDQAVCKRRFPMVDMGDDAEIAYVFHEFESSPEGPLEKSRYSYKQAIL